MRTEQAKTRGGKPHTGIFWKVWAVREGENRQLYVCYRANGKLRWEKVPTNSIRDAQSLRRLRLPETNDGDYIDPSKGRITLAVVAERWIESLSCKPQSVMRYRAWLSGHIIPRVGSRELRSLRPEDVETFAAQLRDQLGPSSCRQAVGVLKRILKASVRWGYLRTSPAEAAQPQFAPQRRQEIKPLSRREVREASSETVCTVADSPLGPYSKPKDISEKKTWDSQVSDLIYLKESDTLMALCDQWWIPDKEDINKSRYLLLPVELDPKTGTARMIFRKEWSAL